VAATAGLAFLGSKNAATILQPQCPGVGGISGRGHSLQYLSKRELGFAEMQECVGWTLDQSFAFLDEDPKLKQLMTAIVKENKSIEARGGQYVRVAVMLPISQQEAAFLNPAQVRQALAGAYLAQMQANHSGAISDQNLGIQLVIANEGSKQQLWAETITMLDELQRGAHPVVAVIGLGISHANTVSGARALATRGVPAIGAVLSARTMRTDGLFILSPSNDHYGDAINKELQRQGLDNKKALTICDHSNDEYTKGLAEAFAAHIKSATGRCYPFDGSIGSTNAKRLFGHISAAVCDTQAEVLFYAGRSRDLPALVEMLKSRECGNSKSRHLSLFTGSTGIDVTPELMRSADIDFYCASSTLPADWDSENNGYVQLREAFEKWLRAPLGFSRERQQEGYLILHRDAVAVAVQAARDVFASNGEAPTAQEVKTRIQQREAFLTVSGPVSFKGVEGGWVHDKRTPIVIWKMKQ
jgi:ABC-type branched-subunit amino acid transport system substrate-binding protein